MLSEVVLSISLKWGFTQMPPPLSISILSSPLLQKEFFIDNLLVQIHYIIVMIEWTGLAPWEFEYPFPGSLTSTFLDCKCRGT